MIVIAILIQTGIKTVIEMNKKRFVTVLDINEKQHYIIDCKDTLTAFKAAQKFYRYNEYRLGEHRYTQVRFRSTIAPRKLGYKWKSLGKILNMKVGL